MQQEIEEAALKKEDDQLSQERLAELQKELAELREQFNAMKAQWENEKAGHRARCRSCASEIEQVQRRDRAAPSATTT